MEIVLFKTAENSSHWSIIISIASAVLSVAVAVFCVYMSYALNKARELAREKEAEISLTVRIERYFRLTLERLKGYNYSLNTNMEKLSKGEKLHIVKWVLFNQFIYKSFCEESLSGLLEERLYLIDTIFLNIQLADSYKEWPPCKPDGSLETNKVLVDSLVFRMKHGRKTYNALHWYLKNNFERSKQAMSGNIQEPMSLDIEKPQPTPRPTATLLFNQPTSIPLVHSTCTTIATASYTIISPFDGKNKK